MVLILIPRLVPAKAGIQPWVPAFAGTSGENPRRAHAPPARRFRPHAPFQRLPCRPCGNERRARGARITRGAAAHVAETGAACAVLRHAFGLGAVRRDLRCVLARRRHEATADLVRVPGASRRRHAGLRRRTSRKKRSAFQIVSNGGATKAPSMPPTGAAAAKVRRALRFCRSPICATSPTRTMWRRRTRSRHGSPAPCARGLFGASRSGAAAAVSIAAHHPSQCVARRDADRPRLAPPQDQATAARGVARCLRLDEPLHRIFCPFFARRRG